MHFMIPLITHVRQLPRTASPSAQVFAGLEFTRREIVAKIHIGEATLAKRVTEFATTAAGDLTLEEFDQRGRALEDEQMALLESTQPTEEAAASGCCCIHIGVPRLCFALSWAL